MGIMKIYRVEHISGYGIWRAETENGRSICQNYSFYCELDTKHSKFPIAQKDVEKFIPGVHYCAFKSLRQLNIWVKKEWRQELKSFDFKFYEIEIEEKNCLIGKKQICFKKEHIINKKEILKK